MIAGGGVNPICRSWYFICLLRYYTLLTLAVLIASGILGAQSWTPIAATPALSLVDGKSVYTTSTNFVIAAARAPGEGCESPVQHIYAMSGTSWIALPGLDSRAPPRRPAPTASFRQASNRMIVFAGGPSSGCPTDPAPNALWVL